MDNKYGPPDGSTNYKQESLYEYTNPVITQQPQLQPIQATNQQVNVTVVNQLPVAVVRDVERGWDSGICACCEDISSCLCMWLVGPCYLCCYLSGRMGEHCCTPICLSCIVPGMFLTLLLYRTKLRARHGIRGSAIDDCCCVNFCPLCVACQIKRELDYIKKSSGESPF